MLVSIRVQKTKDQFLRKEERKIKVFNKISTIN